MLSKTAIPLYRNLIYLFKTNKTIMKKIMKMCLMVAMLTIGTQAFADTRVIYERGTETPWNANDVAVWGATGLDETYGLHQSGGNYSNSATLNIAHAKNSIINIEAYWIGMSGIGEYNPTNYSYFNYAGVYVAENDKSQNSAYSYDAMSTFTEFKKGPTNSANRNYDMSTKCWYVIKMQINTATNKLESLTLESSDKLGTKLIEVVDKPLTNPDYTKVIFGYVGTGKKGVTPEEYLKSIKITETTQDVETADYTINYKFGSDIIKTVNGKIEVGNIVNAESPITIEDQKYYATTPTSLTVTDNAEDNILNVELREAYVYNYSVVSSTGNMLASGTQDENESVTVAVPRYINVAGTLYETPTKGFNDYYHRTYTITENNQQETVTYNATSYKNIAFYAEAEELTGASTGNGKPTRTSMGLTGYGVDLPVTNLPAGTYKIYLHGSTDDGVNDTRAVAFKKVKGTEAIAIAEFSLAGKASWQDYESTEFTLSEAADITFTSEGSKKSGVDYFFIQQTGTLCNVSSAQYATFSSPYALDLDNLTEGYTAYVATSFNGETVTITPAAGVVPANTGLIIKGAEGICNIPLSANAGTAPETNYLVAVTADNTEVSGDGEYVLGVDNNEVKFLQCNVNSATLNAGKSYLSIPANYAKALRFAFSDATDISNVTAKKVNAVTKHLVNGQIVIEKAGKAYTTAGTQMK